jgi:hypothetical protein
VDDSETCEVRKTSFFSISGVIRDCKYLRDVLICISVTKPPNVGDNDFGLYKMSRLESNLLIRFGRNFKRT